MSRISGRTLVGFAVILLLGVVPGFARELHWRGMEVDATLENDGTLAVSELQQMVFTGDWNGGERKFRLDMGQSIDGMRITRIDPATGDARELVEGSLDDVDHWKWTSSNVVRWRSRAPGDREFSNTRIDYRLDYRLKGALVPKGGTRYLLDHDYAFADRDGVIERFEARLRLGDAWRSVAPLPASWSTTALAPGYGFVVPVELEYSGAGLPANASPTRLPVTLRWGAAGAFALAALVFAGGFFRRDGALGRFGAAAGEAGETIDRGWIERRLLPLRAEVVGAAWDRKVGGAEVAALLARLTAEKKLASEVKSSGGWIFKKNDLHLKMLVPYDSFDEYEQPLVQALFFGATETDTQRIRKHYSGSGFDPAAKIRAGVEGRLKRVRGFAEGSPKPSWKPTGLLLLAGLGLLVAAFVAFPAGRAISPIALFALTFSWIFLGMIPALAGQGRVGAPVGSLVAIALGLALHGGLLGGLGWIPGSTLLHLAGALLWATGLARATFNLLKTRESAEGLVQRRELARVRDWIARELDRPAPDLDDAWFPYVLAFGLAPSVDRWFRRFGGDMSSTSWSGSSGGGSFSGSGGGSSWSGGGGSFGGAGATASWALAATAMSAGVAAPSSSGSGGGGGGGSSGGGGGGGW